MRTLVFFFVFLLTIGLTWALSTSRTVGERDIPPIGALLNPFSGFWQNGEAGTPASSQLNMPSLKKPVKIIFDDRLVPHIFAANEQDAYFAQGYVTAQHRLFQMDLITRSTSGRLSEIVGEKLLANDKLQRRKGLVYAATNTLKVWKKSPEAFSKLQAYVDGVNAYITSLAPKDYPLEFKLLNYQPETWTALKTSLMLKKMAQDLCMREEDMTATNTLALFGKETYDFLYPRNNPKESPIVPANVKWNFGKQKQQDSLLLSTFQDLLPLPKEVGEQAPDGIGSNNWAVSGKKSRTGSPILASDPHLRLMLPSIWYETQINCPSQNVYGVCIPGVPGVMIGFNEDIAWGMTNVSHDVLDWYKMDWAEANKTSYYYDGKIKKVDSVIESYNVKGLGMVYDTVKYTVWGPVVYESEGHKEQDLAMRWMGHFEPAGAELEVINNLNKAKNYEEYAAAIKAYSVPAQNFIFASREGDIAIKVQGRFPIKKEGQGQFVQDGSKSSSDWQGFIPEAHNPYVKNPARGFVSSANQHSTAPDYPYYYNGRFEDYRGRAINELLGKMGKVTPKDMMDLQNNTYSIKAREALTAMLPLVKRKNLEQWKKDYLDMLEQWNYEYDAKTEAAVLFEEWFSTFCKLTWDEIEIAEKSNKIKLKWPEEWRTIALLENNPKHSFFDQKATPKKETAWNIVNQSFQMMCTAIAEKEDNKEDLAWAKQQKTAIRHLLDKTKTVEFPLSVKDISVGGNGNVLNAITNRGTGPSWRMVVSFEDELKAYGVYPGGQSGNPGSVYYDNMIDSWAKGSYYRLNFMKKPADLGDKALFTISMTE